MGVTISEFDPAFAKKFADLNYQWIAESYGIEQHDHDILDHPFESVIRPGGQIFFALAEGEVAGTVAMIPYEEDAFELTKMAVDPDYRGRGLGERLMEACIKFARDSNDRKRIMLESNTKQAAAIALYRKFGFKDTPLDPNSQYVRANIRMELIVS